jgi:hypothetical protein
MLICRKLVHPNLSLWSDIPNKSSVSQIGHVEEGNK